MAEKEIVAELVMAIVADINDTLIILHRIRCVVFLRMIINLIHSLT